MYKNWLLFVLSIIFLMIAGGICWGQCVPDNNDYSLVAEPIGFDETVSDWVCPADTVDYYVLQVGEDLVLSGSILFASTQTGTEFKIDGVDTGASFQWSSTDAEKEKTLTIPAGQLQSDTYYLRVTFYSNYPGDHDYTITVDLAEKEESTGFTFKPGMAILSLPKCPWPSPRGNVRNTSRSSFEGPVGTVLINSSSTITPTVTNATGDLRYNGLVAGPDGKIYYTDTISKKIRRYTQSSKARATVLTHAGTRPPIFSADGKFYTIEAFSDTVYGISLVCYDDYPNQEAWRKGLPLGVSYGIMNAGEYIYVRASGNQNKLTVWDKSGNSIKSINFPVYIVGVAEDNARDKFYVQTTEGFYQFDWSGNQKWIVDTTELFGMGSPSAPWEALGPMVGPNGRIWIEVTGYWAVYNTDGSQYKQGSSGASSLMSLGSQSSAISAAAIGSDGRLYIAAGPGGMLPIVGVACYQNWDEEVWSVQIPGAEMHGISDLVVDSKNRAYICYSYSDYGGPVSFRWQSLSPTDGSTIHVQENTGVPESLSQLNVGAELAIGDNKKLILLHHGGFIGVYSLNIALEKGMALTQPLEKEPKSLKKLPKTKQ